MDKNKKRPDSHMSKWSDDDSIQLLLLVIQLNPANGPNHALAVTDWGTITEAAEGVFGGRFTRNALKSDRERATLTGDEIQAMRACMRQIADSLGLFAQVPGMFVEQAKKGIIHNDQRLKLSYARPYRRIMEHKQHPPYFYDVFCVYVLKFGQVHESIRARLASSAGSTSRATERMCRRRPPPPSRRPRRPPPPSPRPSPRSARLAAATAMPTPTPATTTRRRRRRRRRSP
ncbi:hypothetical protein GGR56DRAFT_650391 [Xylariaceae sp. FL0804]|nr:hypothetical protein GGR56DRAFT_650391 [Xylariaceae sp. FL0804]